MAGVEFSSEQFPPPLGGRRVTQTRCPVITLTAAGSEAGQGDHIAGRRYVTKLVNRNNPALCGIRGSSRENVDIGGIADGAIVTIKHPIDIEDILDILPAHGQKTVWF